MLYSDIKGDRKIYLFVGFCGIICTLFLINSEKGFVHVLGSER